MPLFAWQGLPYWFVARLQANDVLIYIIPGPNVTAVSGSTFAPSAYGQTNTMVGLTGVSPSGSSVYALQSISTEDQSLKNPILSSDAIKANINTNNSSFQSGIIVANDTGDNFISSEGTIAKFPIFTNASVGITVSYGSITVGSGF